MEEQRKHPIEHSIVEIGKENTPFYSIENNFRYNSHTSQIHSNSWLLKHEVLAEFIWRKLSLIKKKKLIYARISSP